MFNIGKDKIVNLGGPFCYINRRTKEFCKMLAKKVYESINLILENSSGDDLIDYKVMGNSVQDGTPTPDTPIEIKNVGDLVTDSSDPNYGKYKIPVTCSGKNLFNPNSQYYKRFGTNNSLVVNNNNITVENKTGDANGWIWFNIPVVNNQNITISYENMVEITENANNKICYSFNDVAIENYTGITSKTKIDINKLSKEGITVSTNNYLVLMFRIGNGINGYTISNLQVEYNNSKTQYEPYHAPITTNIYLDKPLRKINNVYDEIDFINKKRINRIGEVVFNGSEGWKAAQTGTANYSYRLSDYYYGKETLNSSANGFCTYYPLVAISNGNTSQGLYASATNHQIAIRWGTEDTIANFKTWLSTHNVKVDYELATTTEETINLPNIPTFEGTTIITFGSEVDPSNAWVKYYANE